MRVASYWSAASGWRAGVLQSEVRADGTADVVDCADAIAAWGGAAPPVTVRGLLTSSAGTPSGVGFARTPPLFLRESDTVEVEIGGLGAVSNRVSLEPGRYLAAVPLAQ
jgi:CubicO group peptidase (beta-lactamase class C family)